MKTYDDFIEEPPVVFISYSWTSEDHINRVLELAKRLISDGVEVKIDKWNLKEGQDKFKFMEQMVLDTCINKVLIICDKQYADKANKRIGGVGSETQIITPEIYNDADQTKFIPIIFERDDAGSEYTPAFLKSRIYIDLSNIEKNDSEYLRLLRSIFGRPENEKPPIGSPPSFIFENKSIAITKTNSKIQLFKNAIFENKSIASGIFEDYLENLHFVLENEFLIDQDNSGSPFDELVIENINAFIPYRDEFIEIIQFLLKYKLEDYYFQSLFNFFEKLLSMMRINEGFPTSSSWDNYRFIGWELFLYLIAFFIKERKLPQFRQFTETNYFIENENYSQYENFVALRQFIRSLDEYRKNRLETRDLSISVNELKQRCYKNITFNGLMQADFILFLKSKKLNPDSRGWFPSTLIYVGYGQSNFEFFIRASQVKELNLLLDFVGFENKEELLEFFQNDRTLNSQYFTWSHLDLGLMTNSSKLGTL
jgi:hypothetical protein